MAAHLLNNVTSQIFRHTTNFESFEIHLYFVCQLAIRPSCARCRAPEISHDKGNGGRFTKRYSEDDLPTVPWRFLFLVTQRGFKFLKLLIFNIYAVHLLNKVKSQLF